MIHTLAELCCCTAPYFYGSSACAECPGKDILNKKENKNVQLLYEREETSYEKSESQRRQIVGE